MPSSSIIESSPCDLCGHRRFEIISRKDRKGQPLNTGLCLGCGLIAHQPMPDEQQIAAYYQRQYRQDYHGEATPSRRRIMRAWNNGQRIADQLAPWMEAGQKVFEVGAGIGCTVKSLAERGMIASGIEPNEQFNHYTRSVLHAEVRNCNLFDDPGYGDQDMVLLIHVIEHFTSPVRALLNIRELLREDGLLCIECPNVAAPFATFGRLFHFAHTYNFAPETLKQLAARCGFELVTAFTDEDHPDIRMLFRKVDVPSAFHADPSAADRVRAAIHRYNLLTYHLRPSYWQRRLRKLHSYWQEYRQADDFVTKLEARFRS